MKAEPPPQVTGYIGWPAKYVLAAVIVLVLIGVAGRLLQVSRQQRNGSGWAGGPGLAAP